MDFRPGGVILPAFRDHELRRAEAITDFSEYPVITAVSGVVDTVPSVVEIQAAPERAVSFQRVSASEMLRRREREGDPVVLCALPPVERTDLFFRHAPSAKDSINTQGNKKCPYLVLDCSDRPVVEMVVMIMGDKKHVDLRKFLRGQRQFGKAFRSGKAHRRASDAENRIDEDVGRPHLQQEGRMPKPGEGQVVLLRFRQKCRFPGREHRAWRLPAVGRRGLSRHCAHFVFVMKPPVMIPLRSSFQFRPLLLVGDFPDRGPEVQKQEDDRGQENDGQNEDEDPFPGCLQNTLFHYRLTLQIIRPWNFYSASASLYRETVPGSISGSWLQSTFTQPGSAAISAIQRRLFTCHPRLKP